MSKNELANRGDFFFEMEGRDEQQMIAEYEGKVLSEITYRVKGKTAISYDGIKFLANKLGHIKVLPESIKCEYIEKPEPMWVATVVALNEKYETQMPGAGEQPYLWKVEGEMVPNPFGRRTAISKATRNAIRAVIPEAMIIKFLEDVKAGKITPNKPLTPRQAKSDTSELKVDPDEEKVKATMIANDLDTDHCTIYTYLGTLIVKPSKDFPGERFNEYNKTLTRLLKAEWNAKEERWEVPI